MHFLQHPMTQYKVIISQTKPIRIGVHHRKGFQEIWAWPKDRGWVRTGTNCETPCSTVSNVYRCYCRCHIAQCGCPTLDMFCSLDISHQEVRFQNISSSPTWPSLSLQSPGAVTSIIHPSRVQQGGKPHNEPLVDRRFDIWRKWFSLIFRTST